MLSTQEMDNKQNDSDDFPDLPDEKLENDEEELTITYCDIYKLFNEIQFTYDKLFIDIRPVSEFEKLKIKQFINIPFAILNDDNCDEKLIEKLMNANKTNFIQNTFDSSSKLISFNIIYVISNQYMIDNKMDIKLYKYLNNIIFDTFDNNIPIVSLNVSFNNFYKQFPFLCYKDNSSKIFKYPSQIINNELFLGNMTDATTKQVLLDLKITHIINMTPQFM
eukprot:97021_1